MNEPTITNKNLQFKLASSNFGIKFMRACRDIQFTVGLVFASSGFANCIGDNHAAGIPLVIGGVTYYITAICCNNIMKAEKDQKSRILSLYNQTKR